jgi:hypothetical protein
MSSYMSLADHIRAHIRPSRGACIALPLDPLHLAHISLRVLCQRKSPKAKNVAEAVTFSCPAAQSSKDVLQLKVDMWGISRSFFIANEAKFKSTIATFAEIQSSQVRFPGRFSFSQGYCVATRS